MNYNHKLSWILTKWYIFAFVKAKYNCTILCITYEKKKTVSHKSPTTYWSHFRFTVDHRGKDRFHTFFLWTRQWKKLKNFGKAILDSFPIKYSFQRGPRYTVSALSPSRGPWLNVRSFNVVDQRSLNWEHF